ncbi:MAG: WG repeat-containing protein [Chitinophagaceae bacterium]|nr:WG repeat-containing protein [Chitinophagaceae bacterium]
MTSGDIIKHKGGLIKQVENAISITNKLLIVSDPFLIPYRKKDKWGYCTADKKIVIDCVYDNARFFSEGLAVIKFNGKYSYIDKKGKLYPRCT